MNYARFLNPVSKARKPSAIRLLTELQARSPPSLISLAGGQPNQALFPYKDAEIRLKDGSTITIDDKLMATALQYGPTRGYDPLVGWLKELQRKVHGFDRFEESSQPQYEVCVTTGSQDGLCKAFEMLVQPKDNVLIDVPAYSGTLAALRPMGCNLLGVQTDKDGTIPDSLRAALSRWRPEDAKNPNSDIPRIYSTIPNGVNPTGFSTSTERRHEVYKIAQEYDLLIMEDDPYYYLQFSENPAPSYLSMDTDGRVLRSDSFSKIISSGMRLGFITGPKDLVSRIILHMMVSTLHTSSFTQIMAHELLSTKWGHKGFLNHIKQVQNFYSGQKDAMKSAVEKHLTGLVEWDEPVAGMFFWMKLKGISDTKKLIQEKALAKEVLLVPGCAFMPDEDAPSPYVRASYSLTTPDKMDQAMSRLAELIREELALMSAAPPSS